MCMLQAIISSAFESRLGLGQYASLAAALEEGVAAPCARQRGSASHGLDTASWFLHETAMSESILDTGVGEHAQVRSTCKAWLASREAHILCLVRSLQCLGGSSPFE